MNSKSVTAQDKYGCTPVDLKKLYSHHVLENNTLQRQKSDIESAKQKKLKELNNNTSAFLRKYDKYNNTPPRSTPSRLRRGSVDVNQARAIELRYQNRRPSTCAAKDENVIKSKSFARDSINSDCPYSLDSWNTLVGSDTDILESKKKVILYSCEERSRSNSAEDLHDCEDYVSMHSIKDPRLLKRRTLKPLNVDSTVDNFEEDALDAEIMEIQNKGKARERRHSVIDVCRNNGLPTKLPSIESGLKISDKRKSSSLEKLSKAPSIEDLRPLKVRNRRRNTTAGGLSTEHLFVTIQSPVPEVNTPDIEKLDSKSKMPRPVANAAVFIQGEDSKDSKTDSNKNLCDNVSDVPKTTRSDNSNVPTNFLPAINTNRSTDCAVGSIASKRVQFSEDDKLTTQQEESNQGEKSTQRLRRQHKLTMATLKLFVDSHHGAAKLRYIAILAREMEKEEAAKRTPANSSEPNPYEQLNNCRHKQDSFVDSC